MHVEYGIVLAACLIAAVADLRTRKIPNVLTGGVMIVALGFAAMQGAAVFATSCGLLLGVLVVGTVAFAQGWLGGGDVKLLAAANASLPPGDALAFMTYTAIGGGILALVLAAATGRLPSALASVARIVRPFALYGSAGAAPAAPTTMPYALAIAAGFIAVALSHSVTPFLRLPL